MQVAAFEDIEDLPKLEYNLIHSTKVAGFQNLTMHPSIKVKIQNKLKECLSFTLA